MKNLPFTIECYISYENRKGNRVCKVGRLSINTPKQKKEILHIARGKVRKLFKMGILRRLWILFPRFFKNKTLNISSDADKLEDWKWDTKWRKKKCGSLRCLENPRTIEKLYNKAVDKFLVSLVLLLQEI